MCSEVVLTGYASLLTRASHSTQAFVTADSSTAILSGVQLLREAPAKIVCNLSEL